MTKRRSQFRFSLVSQCGWYYHIGKEKGKLPPWPHHLETYHRFTRNPLLAHKSTRQSMEKAKDAYNRVYPQANFKIVELELGVN